jgi:hypothetical protein
MLDLSLMDENEPEQFWVDKGTPEMLALSFHNIF